MNIYDACDKVATAYVPQDEKPGERDHWIVMRGQKLLGDCADFVITVLYHLTGGWLPMLWAILTGKAKIHRVKTRTGAFHCVGQVGSLWFDSWTRKPMTRSEFDAATGHTYLFQRSFLGVCYKMSGVWGMVALGVGITAVVTLAVFLLKG